MRQPDPEWPYICYTSHPWPEVQEWCDINIGQFDQHWYKLGEDIMASMMTDYISTYMFRDEQHAVLFQLRWS